MDAEKRTECANGLRLEDYILHLLSVLPGRFEVDPNADIDDLLPWNDGMMMGYILMDEFEMHNHRNESLFGSV